MKRLKRLLISSLLAVSGLVVFQGTSVHAATGYQGMVGYRDGVLMNKQWHAAVYIYPAGPGSSAGLVEAVGPGYFVQECSYNTFMSYPKNNFVYRKTGYKKYTTSSDRDKIVSTAKYLANMHSIGYTITTLISTGNLSGRIIYPGNITNARCDGVAEYCYEFNGIPIQGNPWDISTVEGAMVHNSGYDGSWGMTPITQASCMDSY